MQTPSVSGQAFKEVISLLYWSMLAACTVGPGTVVTCARAGAEQGLQLIWALLFATLLAYTLQEGTARLTITSGKSLGQCLRFKYRNTWKMYNTALICWVVSISVYLGNMAYESNNWAGGMSAIYSLPGVENTTGVRIGCCIGYAVVVYGLLVWDKTQALSVCLGVILLVMITLFLWVVCILGVDMERFARGLLPSIPPGSSNLVLSLVGTTSIGFNLFLGSSMAEGKTKGSAQRGIAFSVCGALAISVLIMIVGDGVTTEGNETFTVESLADLIETTVGELGLWIFGLGFIAAAVSSMLTVPLGAALTADSMFTEKEDAIIPLGNGVMTEKPTEYRQRLPRWIYHFIMISMILVATVVISANFPTEQVIQVAQVFNGCLLPFFAICLLLCLNDEEFMYKSPQKWWANIFLFVAVTITLFLACNVFIQNVLGGVITGEGAKLGIAAGLAPAGMTILCFTTSLGKDLIASFKRARN